MNCKILIIIILCKRGNHQLNRFYGKRKCTPYIVVVRPCTLELLLKLKNYHFIFPLISYYKYVSSSLVIQLIDLIVLCQFLTV